MKKTRFLLVLAAATLSAGSLVACTDEPSGDNSKTITMWATFNATYQATIDKAIAKYEQAYPGYHVEYTKYSGNYSDLASACTKGFSANNYPDMAVVYPDSVADFIMAGRAQDMSSYMYNSEYGWSEEDIADIPSGYLAESTSYFVEGAYSLPLCKSTEAMYYNKKIISLDLSLYDAEINGGEPITEAYINNLTWDELIDHLGPALIKYNKDNGDALIDTNGANKESWAVLGYDSDANFFITLAEQYGYGYTSINKATGAGSVDFVNDDMKGLMKKLNGAYKNRIIATQGTIGDYSNKLTTTGQMLFAIGSTGGVSYQFSDTTKYDVGVARIPHAPNKEYKVINQGPSMAFLKSVTNAEAHAEQCWKFYKILTSVEIATEWSLNTGYAPVRLSVADTDAYLDYADENQYELNTVDRLTARNATYVGSVLDYLYSSPVFYGSSKARNAVEGLLADCLRSKDIDSEIDSIFTRGYNNAI